MISVIVAALADGVAGLAAAGAVAPGMDLGRGAIAGGLIVAMAFLAGYAAIRRSGLAACALLMVIGAAALEFSWLGFYKTASPEIIVLLQALFAAAAIVFLSASIGAARYNPLLGGVMFTAALIIGGMGLINFFDRVDLAQPMRWSVLGIGGFASMLALAQAFRGDLGARLILPGVALAAAAPLVGPLGVVEGASANLAAHGLFTIGILAASLVALTESAAPRLRQAAPEEVFHGFQAADAADEEPAQMHHAREREQIVLDSQIARVLDYSGVAIWDWSPDGIDQTETLPALLGADSGAPFTPEALRKFIHKDDAVRFEAEVVAAKDGPFDVTLKLFDGRKMRMRGARAADEKAGVLERLVAFIETAPEDFVSPKVTGVDGAAVRKATEAAIVPDVSGASSKLSAAIENGGIVAAYQPILSLEDGKVAGYEALARWRDQEEGAEEGPETFVKAAEAAGKGGALARTMLDQAASFLAEKIKSEKRKDLFVAMNVSWRQISDAQFADAVRGAIAKHALPKKALILELTEADAVSDSALAGKVFKTLKEAGAALAFDDFGAGFTCLSNLHKYDFDFLKIDKSFAVDLENGGDGAKIVSALAALGKDLGLKVIVEGVESKAAAKAALDSGCGYGQGFALGKPAENNRAVDKQRVLKRLAGITDVDKSEAEDSPLNLTADAIVEIAENTEKKSGRWNLWPGSELR